VEQGTRVLFFNLGEAESAKAYELMQQLRGKGIASELFHETTKFDKQFKYAEKKNIPYIIIIGSQELEVGKANVKDLRTGVQHSLIFTDLLAFSF
jgi:histidyl-tRNA synthetase